MFRPDRKTAKAYGAVIKHNGCSGCHIDAKLRRDPDDVIAQGEGLWRQRPQFRSQKVCRSGRMAKRWQVHRIIDEFNTDQRTVLWQHHVAHFTPLIKRQVS